MLANERQRLILQLLHQNGQVLVSRLSEQLHVSDETIRRDINALHAAGSLRRVHGGAVLPRETLQEEVYPKRALINPEAKRRIGRLAASFIQDQDVVVIGQGVTTDTIAPAITGRDLTILTTSITSLSQLMEARQRQQFTGSILILGGTVDIENRSTYGPLTERMLSGLSIDKAFIGATAVDEDGIHMFNQSENALSAMMIRRSSQTYILAERGKLEKQALYKTCELDEIHYLLSDSDQGLSASFLTAVHAAGIHLSIAPEEVSHA